VRLQDRISRMGFKDWDLGMRSIHRLLYNCVLILEDLTILALLSLALAWLSMLGWKSGQALYGFLLNFPSLR